MKQNKKPKNEYIRKPVDKTNPYKDDVLYTPNGQWQYPGQVTKIPGGDITMQGVPYPVMGIDNLGNQQVMMPNMNYHFPGQHVTEYPVDLRISGNLKNLRGSVGANFGSNRVELNMATPTNKFDPSFGVKYARTFAQGGLLNKTLTCPNCGWSWKAADGGKDIATCHKCGGTAKLAYGGIPMAQNGKTHRDSVEHQVDKILKYEQLRGGPGAHPLDGTDGYPDYRNPKYKKMLMNNILPEVNKIMPNASAMEKGEAMDFIFNSGWDKANNLILKDPRAFALQEYYRKNDPYKLDADGKWAGRKGAAYSFDQEYANTIGKLPENERRIIMNKGRDWYYKNIDNPSPGVPNSDYYDTWYGRIWNTNDYSEFNPKNPKFRPKKKAYGGDPSLPDLTGHYQEGGWLDTYPFGGRFTKTHTHMQAGGSNKVQPLNLKKYEALPETTGRMQNKYPSLDTLKKQQAARLKNIRKPTAEEIKLYAKPDTNVIRPESAGYITKDSPEIIGKAIPHKIAAYNRAVAESSTPDILQVRKEQPVEDKIMDAVLNPFTAATNLYQHGYLPDYFTQGPKNINDIPAQIAFSYTNPGKVLSMAKASTELVPDIAKVVKDPTSGRNYLDIADDILSMAHVSSLTDKVPGFVKAINDFKKKELGFLPGGLSVNVGNIKKLYSNESKMETGLDRPHPFQYGGWLDEYTDEYRRGGSLYTPPGLKKKVRKKGTSKNIVSSINKLFTRNYDLFGPSGKAIYNPNSKYQSGGGWLDNLD